MISGDAEGIVENEARLPAIHVFDCAHSVAPCSISLTQRAVCANRPDHAWLLPHTSFATPTLILSASRDCEAGEPPGLSNEALPGQDFGRVDVSEPASISSGIAQRYATAMFELAKTGDQLSALAADIDALDAALGTSADLTAMVSSPIYSRDAQQSAIVAIAKALNLSQLLTNTLALMASKRRLFVLPQFIKCMHDKIADEKGEVTAEVASATSLTKQQSKNLAATLKAATGKDVIIKSTVDEALIGGLVVKIGSRMIDTSIAAKLANLQNSMKEVG